MDNIQFTFITSHEKLDIMMCQPEKEIINHIKQKIIHERSFKDRITKEIFEKNIEKLIYNRSLGIPKQMKKPKRSSIK
jgi:hypothetical protein